jgi:hypothetical protein
VGSDHQNPLPSFVERGNHLYASGIQLVNYAFIVDDVAEHLHGVGRPRARFKGSSYGVAHAKTEAGAFCQCDLHKKINSKGNQQNSAFSA